MAFDEIVDDNERERKKLFEEIRKRAEDAELARIEAEELRVDTINSDIANLPSERPRTTVQPSHIFSTDIQPQLPESVAPEDVKPKRHVDELLEAANRLYQNEQYLQALSLLDEICELRPDHSAAQALRSDVERARALADRLKEDELRASERDLQQETAEAVHQVRHNAEVVTRGVEIQQSSIEDLLVETSHPDSESSLSHKPRWPIRQRIVKAAVVLLMIFGITTGYVLYQNFKTTLLGQKTTVLVFPARSSTHEQWERDGLTMELVSQLSQIPTVHVFSSNTSFSVGNSENSTPKSLEASYVVDWSLEKNGDESVFSYALIDVASSRRVLECSSSISSNNLSAFSQNFIQKMTEFLSVTLNAGNSTRQVNSQAYRMYLRSLSLLRSPYIDLDSVRNVLTESAQRDPEFPSAEVALGWVSVLQHEAVVDTSLRQIEEANRHLQRALSLGAKSADVFRLWGCIEYHRNNFKSAVERLEQSRDLAPSDAATEERLAMAYLRSQRIDDAVSAAAQQVESDPLNERSRELLGMMYLMQGNSAVAAEEFERLRASNPTDMYSNLYLASLVATNRHERALDMLRTHVMNVPSDYVALYDLGRMYQLAGKSKADWQVTLQLAMKIIEDTLRTNPSHARAYTYRGLAQTRLGEFAAGVKSVKRAIALSPVDPVVLQNAARVFALQRNRVDEAVEFAKQSSRLQFSLTALLDLDLASIRGDQRFQTIFSE